MLALFQKLNVRVAFRSLNSRNMVVFAQKINGVTGVSEWAAMDDDYDYHQEISRSGFADMLHDTERNQKYYHSLKAAIDKMHAQGKPANVLDIGTGTGLLSIMAAQCGADTIIACEAFKPMANCAMKIIKENGFENKITVIPKRSTELTVGADGDLKTKQNILVTEVFDTELIGEGAIETFRHASETLLETDCIVVPESATMFAQIVESPTLQRWNKLMDIADDDGDIIIRTPREIIDCPGSAAVHDLQLSQVSRTSFKEITKPIEVFHFDWSGKTVLEKNRTSKQSLKSLITGSAQMVFMWWDLKMDGEGKIMLSCAPWWNHPDTNFQMTHPEDSIPWRDHWMQAVYYFPKEIKVVANEDLVLSSSHDEYSLWFNLEKQNKLEKELLHPICNCGVHMTYSRTHVAYMNDNIKNKKFLRALQNSVNKDTVCLCLNGASLMGIAAAKYGAKKVIYIESGIIAKRILTNYIQFNNLEKIITILPDIESLSHSDYKDDISLLISDPHFMSALLPWDNLRHGYYISALQPFLNSRLKFIPMSCSIWVMSVEFLNLHKIKSDLGICENINLSLFDDLIKDSRNKSDDEIEPQPLWEYPCICKSKPIKIVDIDFTSLIKSTQTIKGSVQCDNDGVYNGFVFWILWNLDGNTIINTGPLVTPELNQRVLWDPHIRQAVKILDENKLQNTEKNINFDFTYNLIEGTVDVSVE